MKHIIMGISLLFRHQLYEERATKGLMPSRYIKRGIFTSSIQLQTAEISNL